MFSRGLGEKIVRGIVGDPVAFGFYSGFEGSMVTAIAVQPDGKILVSGDFTKYNGVSVETLVRLNSDLSLDTSFNPTGAGVIADGSKKMWADEIYVFSDGRIALLYSSVAWIQDITTGGTSITNRHPGFVILDSNGALDPSHNTFKDVRTAVSANVDISNASAFRDDELVIKFNVGYYIAHFNADGTIKRTYNALSPYSTSPGNIKDLEIDSNNKVWAVGKLEATHPTNGNNYSTLGGIWTWDSNGVRDLTTFKGAFSISDSGYSYPIHIEIDSADNLWIAATKPYYPDFFDGDTSTQLNGMVYKLDQSGNILTNLNFNQYSYPSGVFVNGSFKLFNNDYLVMGGGVDGGSSVLDPNNSRYWHKMLVVNPDGSFNINFASSTLSASSDDKTFGKQPRIFSIAQIDSDSFLVGGNFTKYDGVNRNLFIGFNTNGTVETPATY